MTKLEQQCREAAEKSLSGWFYPNGIAKEETRPYSKYTTTTREIPYAEQLCNIVSVILSIARPLQERVEELEKKIAEMKARNIINAIKQICEKCGHTITEDGCAFCISTSWNLRNTEMKNDRDRLKAEVDYYRREALLTLDTDAARAELKRMGPPKL